jgi:hypothetical protein
VEKSHSKYISTGASWEMTFPDTQSFLFRALLAIQKKFKLLELTLIVSEMQIEFKGEAFPNSVLSLDQFLWLIQILLFYKL